MNRYTRWRLNQAEQPTLTAGRAATVAAVLSVAGFAAITAPLPLPFEQYISGVAIYAFALLGGIFTGMIAAREPDPCACDEDNDGTEARWVSREDFAKLSRPPARPSIPRFATIGECLMAGYHLDFLPGDRIGCAHCPWIGNSAPQFAGHLLTCGDTDEGNHL